MTTGGWIFMLTAWTVVITVTSFCFYHLLKGNKPDAGKSSSHPTSN